jgi:hypothetical protein
MFGEAESMIAAAQEPAIKPPAYLLVLAEIFFDPEDGGDMFLRNVGCISTDYTALHPRR